MLLLPVVEPNTKPSATDAYTVLPFSSLDKPDSVIVYSVVLPLESVTVKVSPTSKSPTIT